MPNFRITGGYQSPFVVRLANCDWAHAESVKADLEADPQCPDVLQLVEVRDLYDDVEKPGVFKRALDEPAPAPARGWFRRGRI